MTPINSVITRITLQKSTSRAGEPYALFNFEAVSVLDPEAAAHAKDYARQFMEIMNDTEPVSASTQTG